MKQKTEINEYTFTSNADLCFAFVSDLHDTDNEPILEEIKKRRPNGVLIAGDFVHNTEMYKKGIEFLRLANDIAPVFCSLGNHERKLQFDPIPMIKETKATLLDNDYAEFSGIFIGGLSSGYKQNEKQGELKQTPAPDLDFVNRFSALDGFKILLSHHPEYYPAYLKDKQIDIVLSGHAHGGQWRIFNRGIFSPGQGLFPKYTSGLYGNLLVGRGLGNPWPFPRIMNAPEIIFVKLVRE